MKSRLVGEEGPLEKLVLSFDEGDHWTVGRDPDECQLLVEDPAVSRKHLLCIRTTEGLQIDNLSKTNPSQINGEPLSAPYLLRHGDLVRIGNTLFRYFEDGAQLMSPEEFTGVSNRGENAPQEESPKEESKGESRASAKEREARSDRGPPSTLFGEDIAGEMVELAQVNFSLLDTGRWLLKVISGPNTGAEFAMQPGESYLIGTDPNSCDVVFYDTSVSRQHAKISISPDQVITLEDLKSRNGTLIHGDPISQPTQLPPNTIVSMGTTSFVVYDREGEMQTIISPLLPSIIKVLQKQGGAKGASEEGKEPEKGEAEAKALEEVSADAEAKAKAAEKERSPYAYGTMIILGILAGLFLLTGVALRTLLFEEPVVVQSTIDPDKTLGELLSNYPEIKFSFNKATGRLLLVGHVGTSADRSQLLYNLQNLGFIKDIDDSDVIIDEFVSSEANQLLGDHPEWKGLTIFSPTPGRFVASGSLQTRRQAEQVWDYLTRNFRYIDVLENKILVEEDLIGGILRSLNNSGINTINVQLSNGDLILTGTIALDKKPAFEKIISEIETGPAIRSIRNLVLEKTPMEAVINITKDYQVTGTSQLGNGKLSAVINGRILTEGDSLDGRKIISIGDREVFLEKDGMTYRIDIGGR